jgi:trimethylamine:corrinoid methyltransferase-like protein
MSDAASMTPQRARGGRARRQREAQRVHAVIAGIERKIPTYELLDEEGLARIEAVADAILQEVGMDFRGDDDALRLWREAGAELEGERVRFPAGLLRSVLKTAPSAFIQHARNPERSLRIGGNSVIFAPAYGSPFVQDLAGGGAMGRSPIRELREARLRDSLAASFGRDRLGAGRHPRQQATSRHGGGASEVLRQAVYGVGDDRGACRGLDRHGADRLRARLR